MNNSKEFLGTEPIGKLLFKLAVPSVIAQIVNMLYNLVDRVYIGHMQPVETVGKLALTGVGVCLPIIMVISAFAALMAFGGAPRASIAEGRGDLKESERIMGNSFTMLVAVSVVLTVVFLVFAEPMLRIFGASDNTMAYSNPKVDELLKKGRATEDPAQRKAIYGQFEEAYAERPGHLLVAYLNGNYVSIAGLQGLDTARVLGHHAVGVMWNIEDWTLNR